MENRHILPPARRERPLQGSIPSTPTSSHSGPSRGRLDIGERRAHVEAESPPDIPFPHSSHMSKTQVVRDRGSHNNRDWYLAPWLQVG